MPFAGRGSWTSFAWRAAAFLTTPRKGCVRAGHGHRYGGGAAVRAWPRNDWRATTPKYSGWADTRSAETAEVRPERLAGLYRQLRKAQEDTKNEPGAADFYYGEMEMRRQHRTTPGRTRNHMAVLADLRLWTTRAPLPGRTGHPRRDRHYGTGRLGLVAPP